MEIVYLGHSGFAVKTEAACYLFDYIRGELPAWGEDLPLYLFASHFHFDHFTKKIFEKSLAGRVDTYILSDDIRRKYARRRPSWMEEWAAKIRWARPGTELSLGEIQVKVLKSTDVGSAYRITEPGGAALYHGGDLNWWYWQEESKAWNRNMEVNYKREIASLAGQKLDVAFLPLDPRLGRGYGYGMRFFLETVPVKHVFPMHFWEDYGVAERFVAEYRETLAKSGAILHAIEREGQRYEI